MRLVLPKDKVEGLEPLIFLAGPISFAPQWQDKAVEIIHSINSGVYIASPSWYLREEYVKNSMKSREQFGKQLEWERYYLDEASLKGGILFWLPMPVKHDCTRSYARDTRGELGEWRGRIIYEDVKIIIGAEKDFDGLDVIKRNYLSIKPDMKFYNTLEETCKEAVKQITE